MLDTVNRAKKARDAAERIMGYRIEEFNDAITKLVFGDVRDFLKADLEWLAKVKKMSTPAQFECVRATNDINIYQERADQRHGKAKEECLLLLDTEYHRRRGSYGRKTEIDKAEEFLTSPIGYKPVGTSPFVAPCRAFDGSRNVDYGEAVTHATRQKITKLRDGDGKALMDEYKTLVNNINDTLAACPTWAKLLVAWPDAAKYLIELEPEPKMKPLIVRNTGLEEQVKKFQPKKKSRSAA